MSALMAACSYRSSGTNSWTGALDGDGMTITATATNDVETTAALKTKQVYADAVTLTGTTVTLDFKDGNCFILSGASLPLMRRPGTLKVGQTGKFYFPSGATVDGWNTNYGLEGKGAPTGVTIVPLRCNYQHHPDGRLYGGHQIMFSDWWWSSGAEANKEDGFEIKNSLRFRGAQTLTRTITSSDGPATWSFWVKRLRLAIQPIKPFLILRLLVI